LNTILKQSACLIENVKMNFDYYDERNELKLMSCEHWIRELISLIPLQF